MDTYNAISIEPVYAMNGEFIGVAIAPTVSGVTNIYATINTTILSYLDYEYQSLGTPIVMSIFGDRASYILNAVASISGVALSKYSATIRPTNKVLVQAEDKAVMKYIDNDIAIRTML